MLVTFVVAIFALWLSVASRATRCARQSLASIKSCTRRRPLNFTFRDETGAATVRLGNYFGTKP